MTHKWGDASEDTEQREYAMRAFGLWVTAPKQRSGPFGRESAGDDTTRIAEFRPFVRTLKQSETMTRVPLAAGVRQPIRSCLE